MHKHSGVYGDTAKFVQLLEKFEDSELCKDEFFQANLIMMKFHNYILSSNTDDLLSLMRSTLDKAEFTSKRIPRAWKKAYTGNEWTPSWNLFTNRLLRGI